MTRSLHIGMPKTGSTAIQHALHADLLLANAGNVGKRRGWGALACGFSMNGARHERVEPWRHPITEAPVISDEDFCLADPDTALMLLRHWRPQRVTLVTRRFDHMVVSWWAEQVKHGETRPFPTWMDEVGWVAPQTLPDARRVRMDYVANVWQPNIVREYSDTVVADFYSDNNLGTPPPPQKANASLSHEATEALRRWQQRAHADHSTVQAAAKALADPAQRSHASLIDQETRQRLLWQDAQIRDAMKRRTIAHLRPMRLSLRTLDEREIARCLSILERKA